MVITFLSFPLQARYIQLIAKIREQTYLASLELANRAANGLFA